jgi:pimeloyl-ACP methyl ester carboxylesterase
MKSILHYVVATLGLVAPLACASSSTDDAADQTDEAADELGRGISFRDFVPTGITPILPGQPLPSTIEMTATLRSGVAIAVRFPLLDPGAPIQLAVGSTAARDLTRSEARGLLDELADLYIASPETMTGYVPLLDRVALMPEVLPTETYNHGAGNVRDRGREARRLGFTQQTLDLDGMRYAYVEGGPSAGPTVLILPGYPDGWTTWRHQLTALSGAGYHVIAVDFPGCGDSHSIGAPIARFNHRAITSDISTLLQREQVTRAAVIGHDWGALIAWDLAALHPEQVTKLAVFTVGHPAVYTAPTPPVVTPEALAKLWYHQLFANSSSGVAEYLMKKHRWQLFDYLTNDHPEGDYWKRDLSRPGALRAARSGFVANSNNFFTPDMQTIPAVQTSVLGIISDGDLRYVGADQMELSAQLAPAGRFRSARIANASHWSMADQPAAANAPLLEFLAAP